MGTETTPYNPAIAQKLGADCEKLRLVYWLYNNDDNGCGPLQGIPISYFGDWTMDSFDCDGRNILLNPVPISYNNWNDNFNEWTDTLNSGVSAHQWDWINAGKPCFRVMATITCDDTIYGDFKLTAINTVNESANGNQYLIQPGKVIGPELEVLVCRTKNKTGEIEKQFYDKSGDPIESLLDYYASEAAHIKEPTTGAVPFTAANISKFYSEDELCDCLKSCDHVFTKIDGTAACIIQFNEGGCIYVRNEDGVAELVESGISSSALWSPTGEFKSRSMVSGVFQEDPSDNDYIVQDDLPEGWYFDPTCTGAEPENPSVETEEPCPVIGVRHHCILTTGGETIERKTGFDVSDFDPGDLEIGDPASCTFNIAVDDPSPSFVITPIPGYTFTETSPGNFTADFTYDGGQNPQQPLEAIITLSTGEAHVLTNTDFVLCSGGGSTVLAEYSTASEKQDIKELCYEGKPSAWQDFNGELLNYDELTFCEPDPIEIDPCSDFEFLDLFTMSECTGTLRNREWDVGPRDGGLQSVAVGQALRLGFDFTQPTTVDADWLNLQVNDTNNAADVQDTQIIDGYVKISAPLLVRWGSSSAGYFALEVGECCGDLDLKIEGATEDGTVNPTSDYLFEPGVHQIRMWNIDDFVNTARNMSVSRDGGATWAIENNPPEIELSRVKPLETCKKVKVCHPSGDFYDPFTDELLDKSIFYECTRLCTPIGGSSAEEVAIVEKSFEE